MQHPLLISNCTRHASGAQIYIQAEHSDGQNMSERKNRKREARWVITNKRERKREREVSSVPLPFHTESSQRWTVPRSVRGSKPFPPPFGYGVCHSHREETRTRVNSAPCMGASIIIFTFVERRKPRLLGATNQTSECLRGQGIYKLGFQTQCMLKYHTCCIGQS